MGAGRELAGTTGLGMLKRFPVLLVVLVVMVALTITGLALTKPPPATQVGSPTSSRSPEVPTAPTVRVGEKPYGMPGDPSPIGQGGQSALWFNDGAWWGVLLDAGSQTFRIHQLDWPNLAWIDTGTVVHERSSARSDVLWSGNHLYVVSGGEKDRTSNGVVVSRFSYDPAARVYARDANFPVVLTQNGVRSVSLTRDSIGVLWIAYIDQNSLFVRHSLDTDLVWAAGLTPAAPEMSGQIDAAAITHVGSATALVWTEATTDLVHVGVHLDTQPQDAWTMTSVEVAGLSLGQDELAVTAMEDDGAPRIYIALRTSLDALPNRDRMAPQIVLIDAVLGGQSTVHVVSRVLDEQTKPIALLDSERRTLYVASTSRSEPGSGIYYTQSRIDDISFPAGPGLALTGGETAMRVSALTSSKQPISILTGMVLLGADTARGTYRYVAVDLGPGSTSSPATSADQSAE